jgi:hypothetical protein
MPLRSLHDVAHILWRPALLSTLSTSRNVWRVLTKFWYGSETLLEVTKTLHFNCIQWVKTTWLTRRLRLPTLHYHTWVNVILVARPLLTPLARKLCRYQQNVFTCRKFIRSQTLPSSEVFRCYSWSVTLFIKDYPDKKAQNKTAVYDMVRAFWNTGSVRLWQLLTMGLITAELISSSASAANNGTAAAILYDIGFVFLCSKGFMYIAVRMAC